MECARAIIVGATLMVTRTALAQWWWPPQNPMEVLPECPNPAAAFQIRLSGTWHDSCRPNIAQLSLNGGDIEFHVIRDPPPQFCLTVLTPWSLAGSIGPLAAGVYPVYATYYEGPTQVFTRELMGTVNVSASCPLACYANCDGSTTAPVLNVLDFSCFLNQFAAGATYANCDGSTTAPALNVLDFSCFLNRFAAGCS